jgi:dihydrofolate reductase
MEGGTTFHFVTDGIDAALGRATEAADGRDIRIGGGAATIREYLRAGLIDEMHIVISPTVLGAGEPLFAGIDVAKLGYRCSEHIGTSHAMHIVMTKNAR